MKLKPKPITKQAFEAFTSLDNWKPYEIPSILWPRMAFLPRQDDLLAVYASGCQASPTQMHGLIVDAGMDIIVHEPKPKIVTKYGPEPEINIYHMVFQETDRDYDAYKYLAYGPFNFGALQDHWPSDEDAAIEFYCSLGERLPDAIQLDIGCCD